MKRLALLLIGAGMLVELAPAVATTSTTIGRTIEPFRLPDYHGQPFDLAQVKARAVVIVFLGTECPLVKLYGPRLAELAIQFQDAGVEFVGINSNVQDTITEIAAFARRAGIEFPILKDAQNVVADQFGATRTPEVFLLDPQRVVRYHGRIDDQYGVGGTSGYARNEVERRDLAIAIEELLADKPLSLPETKVSGCLIGRVARVTPGGDITYNGQIASILQDRCVSCHRPGEVGPFALTDYDEVVGWADMIREVVSEGRMPPWFANPEYGHFANDARLSDDQKQSLISWIDHGCPQGDPAELPKPREYTEGWQIGSPHQVIQIPKPITVPAKGILPYKYILVDPKWTEDKWVQAAEVRPGNRAVVHHILLGVISPAKLWNQKPGEGGPTPLTSYVPGAIPHTYAPGVAVYVPARSQLMFEIHYTPNGVEQTDQSHLGVIFADPASVKRRAFYEAAENRDFTIPPFASDHPLEARYTFKTDQLLQSMSPHMHVRGKAFRFEALYPDGRREILLDVPRYDFNWQLRYELVEPKLMPAGTTLLCTGRFDNSDANVSNPDPSAELHFGWQTTDEMMTGFFTSISVDEVAHHTAKVPDQKPSAP
jgi:peroxiredoxin/mono/diheme cytochrome c family protein